VAAVYLASFERTWRLAASMAVLPVAIVIAILYQDYVLAPIGAVVTYIYRLAGFDMEWPY
jgi:hypothetical protein